MVSFAWRMQRNDRWKDHVGSDAKTPNSRPFPGASCGTLRTEVVHGRLGDSPSGRGGWEGTG